MKTQRRGRNAEGSASDKWMGNILQMRKEAVPFLESLGIPKPRSKAEWSYIFKEMGTFLAAKNFIVNCPLAGALYDRLPWPRGRGGQGIGPQDQDSGGSGHHAPHAGPGHQKVPPDHHVHCHGGRGQEAHLPDGNQARALGLGGVRPGPAQHQRMGSGGQGEVQDHRGLHVQVLQGLLEGEPWGDPAAPDYGVAQGQGHLPAAGDGRAPGAAI